MESRKALHFRRCHVCGAVNHREGAVVDRCSSCGKAMARFYYFDDSWTRTYAEDEPQIMGVNTDAEMATPRLSLRGFTVVW